jgi:antitoxin (DNA-binding transcriptional repressor) of toxin-antitoxin stability system
MTHVNIAEANTHLSDLIARAETGATILISRHGRPVVERPAIQQPRQPIDVEALRAFITTLPETPAGTVEAMPDEARD